MLAPTIESQKSDIFLRKLCPLLVGACIAGPPTVRGNILGFTAAANAGRASPAPTLKSQNSAYNQTHSLTVHSRGGALLHPGNLSAAHNAEKRPASLSLAGLISWCTISGSVKKTVQCTVFSDRSPRAERKLRSSAARARPVGDGAPPTRLSAMLNAKKDPQVYRLQVLLLGAPSGTRTQGPLIKSQLLYQLS